MRRQDWRSVTSYVLDRAQPGDSIFFYDPAGEAPFDFYSWHPKPASLRPKTLNEHWLKTGNDPLDPKPGDRVTVPGTNLRAIPSVGNRVWLVLMFLYGSKQEADTGKAVGKWLSSGRQQVDAQDFTLLNVVLFDRNSASPRPSGNQVSVKR
jgi:hypothetical protein